MMRPNNCVSFDVWYTEEQRQSAALSNLVEADYDDLSIILHNHFLHYQ